MNPVKLLAPRASAPRAALALLGIAGALVSAGCQRDDVRHYRVPKQVVAQGGEGPGTAPPGATAPQGMPGAGGTPGAGGMDPSQVPPPPSDAGALRWKLPKGWTESRGGGSMRYATLVAPAKGKLDISVVVLPGPAGGLVANVNRWRGQIGLPPVDEAELARGRKEVRSPAGPVTLFDFTSDAPTKARMVAGILSIRGNSWFVKMVGDVGPVAAARPDFVKLLESLRLD